MAQKRPLAVRILVLLFAFVALFLAVCAHSKTPPAEPGGEGQAAPPESAAADAGVAKQDREFFPATKAPGPLYP